MGSKDKIKCDNCKKIIRSHVFKKFNNNLCADCYSEEFQKRLYSGKYFTFYKNGDGSNVKVKRNI